MMYLRQPESLKQTYCKPYLVVLGHKQSDIEKKYTNLYVDLTRLDYNSFSHAYQLIYS